MTSDNLKQINSLLSEHKVIVEMGPASLLKRMRAIADHAGRTYRFDGDAATAVTAVADDEDVTVHVRGPLDGGWFGVGAQSVIEKMGSAKKIHVIIDSPGGFVSEGLSLYSELRTRAEDGATITCEGRGLVASSAVLPFLAGDSRTLADGTMMMIHNPWGGLFAIGDRDEIDVAAKKVCNALKAFTKNYVDIVARRTENPNESVAKNMKDESWYSVSEAIDFGFAAKKVDGGGDDQAYAIAARDRMAASILNQY